MIRFVWIVILAILIFLVIRLVRLIINFSGGPKADIGGRDKEKDEIQKHFENIEEAEFREIKPGEEDEKISDDNS